ncbi:MAG: exodeoxyribonuclease VII large subunit, partial [Pseudomonadota bacterium]|nr:exodeoxyribonuclease VII large subunit [Pseudomonadota bacterium]
DILENAGLCHFDYLESPFEGLHVEESISMNLLKAADIHAQDPIDAVTIIRGGGSRQGLLALMNEKLARLICNFPVPVITGIGHKDDKGFVVDEVSNVNKDTPSKVVEYILSTIRENAKNASMNIDHIIKDAKYIMNRANTHLHHLTGEMDTRSSETLLFQHEKVHNYSSKLGDQSNHRLKIEESTLKTQLTLLKERATERIRNSKSLLSEYIRIIEKFGPESLLKRGLVIARTKSKKVIKTKEKAQSENTLTLTFQDGDVDVSL